MTGIVHFHIRFPGLFTWRHARFFTGPGKVSVGLDARGFRQLGEIFHLLADIGGEFIR